MVDTNTEAFGLRACLSMSAIAQGLESVLHLLKRQVAAMPLMMSRDFEVLQQRGDGGFVFAGIQDERILAEGE